MEQNRELREGEMQALRVIDIEERPVLALELPEGTTFGEWLGIGRKLRLGSQALNWHIGDWWKFGVSHWGEDETRTSAVEIWGVEGETARVYGWVAEKFDPVRRLTELSFSHYQAAASLPSETAVTLVDRAASEGLSVRDVKREVQAIKAANDPDRDGEAADPLPPPRPIPPQTTRADTVHFAEVAIEAIEYAAQFGQLPRRFQDLLAEAEAFVGAARAESDPVPVDFEIKFREFGRLACEELFNVSRLTVNHWLIQCGKSRLIKDRAAYVRFQREQAAERETKAEAEQMDEIEPSLRALGNAAAHFLRTSRYGGWFVTHKGGNTWLVGTVRKTADEVIAMAERQGFDSETARLEIDAE